MERKPMVLDASQGDRVPPAFGPEDVRLLVLNLLRFDARHAGLADEIAEALVRRWQRVKRPLRGQYPREWVTSALWSWLRGFDAPVAGFGRPVHRGFNRPLSAPVTRMLRPYREGSVRGVDCTLTAALHRAAA